MYHITIASSRYERKVIFAKFKWMEIPLYNVNNDMENKEIIAHKSTDNTQLLTEHLQNTAFLAERFANAFGNGDWAKYAGFFHDLGKANNDWQKYIRGETESTHVNHSEAGAQYVYSKGYPKDPASLIIPYLIAGHHAGLPDYHAGSGNSLKSILSENSYSQLDLQDLQSIISESFPKTLPFGKNDLSIDNPKELSEHFHLWIRMLYSCLVDADFLETEKFMNPEQSDMRTKFSDLRELKQRFNQFMRDKTGHSDKSKINQIRETVLNSCREKARSPHGFFSLNVPTGGGKTLSSMAFALEHAIYHNKKKIIVAIPCTSIIEQTAKVYKYGTDNDFEIKQCIKNGQFLFGEENVLEHHCNYDFEKDNESETLVKQKLATENWDFPIIITTNVQLFESLFNAHNSSCRKLHNLVDSVIILDEVQMLPPEYLKSILSVLRGLVKCFGVTVVFCSATQPAIEGRIGSDLSAFEGIPQKMITPIIDKPEELSAQLNRVTLNTELAKSKLPDWQTLAEKLCEHEQVLCIVQTRKDCRELYSLMPPGTIHLSALMCAEERSHVISQIKEKLRNGESIRVVSTQLVECGVDIDFPVVFRALAGIDSIAQSAGRCNREGKLQRGTVFIFAPPTDTPPGMMRKSAGVTKDLLEIHDYQLQLLPELYREYFTKYYKSLNQFDKPEFEKTMQKEIHLMQFQFRTLSDKYHLIDNSYQGTVYIRYISENHEIDNLQLLESLRKQEVSKTLFRKLSRFSVNIPLNEIRELLKEGRLEEPLEGVFVQAVDDENLYQPGLGFCADSLKSLSTYIF